MSMWVIIIHAWVLPVSHMHVLKDLNNWSWRNRADLSQSGESIFKVLKFKATKGLRKLHLWHPETFFMFLSGPPILIYPNLVQSQPSTSNSVVLLKWKMGMCPSPPARLFNPRTHLGKKSMWMFTHVCTWSRGCNVVTTTTTTDTSLS